MSNLYSSPTAPKPNRPWYSKKRFWIPGGFVALAILGSAVGGGEDTSDDVEAKPQATKTVTFTPTPSQKSAEEAPEDTEAEPEESAEAAAPETGDLPDFVGMSHQDAQDTAQAAGFFSLREKDATGMERLMILDRNWKVCKQEPAPGKHALEKTITLYSVKNDESC